MKIAALIFCGLVAALPSFAALPGKSAALEEGVYGHVDPYNKEIVELRGGRFRYWFSSDVKSNSDPHYPLSGRYDFNDGVLVLRHQQIYEPKFQFRIFEGVATLWTRLPWITGKAILTTSSFARYLSSNTHRKKSGAPIFIGA